MCEMSRTLQIIIVVFAIIGFVSTWAFLIFVALWYIVKPQAGDEHDGFN